MAEIKKIQGQVEGGNSLWYDGRLVQCWETPVDDPGVPKSLDLEAYKNKVIEVSGHLYTNLWEVDENSVKIINEKGYEKITGKIVGFNKIETSNDIIYCFRFSKANPLPLALDSYKDKRITVMGELNGSILYWAQIIEVPLPDIGDRDIENEANSLDDLMIIREGNYEIIERISGNLGSALGYKWSNKKNMKHPCIIIFVPEKKSLEDVPVEEKTPTILEHNGKWCFTDVVSGSMIEDIDSVPLSKLSSRNQTVVDELGTEEGDLIGGMKVTFRDDNNKEDFGTAGIVVQKQANDTGTGNGERGFLTNRHVAGKPGRNIYQASLETIPIGKTKFSVPQSNFAEWYNDIVHDSSSIVESDYAFVKINEDTEKGRVKPGLHKIREIGSFMENNTKTMDIIGQRVISVGCTRGIQRGTVAAYAYQWKDLEGNKKYTDFLIIGEEERSFTGRGDSGKICVTDNDEHRPVGLLWGGEIGPPFLDENNHNQVVWAYATDLVKIRKSLNLALYKI